MLREILLSTVDHINSTSTLVLLSVVGIISLIWYLLWNNSRDRKLLRKLPYIQPWPLVGDLLTISADSGTAFHQFLQWAAERREQGLYRLMILEECWVFVYGAEHIKKLCSSNVNLKKSNHYDTMLPWLGRGLLTSYGSKWRSRRKMLTPSFHFNILKTFNGMINSHAKELRDKLMKDACDTGQSYDILDDVTRSTLDIICDTAMGVEVNALHGENSEYVEALSIIKEGADDRSRSPIDKFDFIYDRRAVGKKVNKAISLAQDFTIQVIKRRREMRDSGTDYEQKKHQPFLDLLLDCTDEEGLSLTDSDIREEVDTFMFEGHDTTSSGIFFTIYLLGET
ncbi:CYP4V2 [Bugula neritina]|uniref:CYP4V2 n=1 Tax=Bugula neritina TaxID=10212 RepID=A0A7J7KAR6_BUGNE|nr:CYP4V2 [Bugula neritina]